MHIGSNYSTVLRWLDLDPRDTFSPFFTCTIRGSVTEPEQAQVLVSSDEDIVIPFEFYSYATVKVLQTTNGSLKLYFQMQTISKHEEATTGSSSGLTKMQPGLRVFLYRTIAIEQADAQLIFLAAVGVSLLFTVTLFVVGFCT